MSLGAKYASTWKRSVNDVDYIIQIPFIACLINLFLQLAKQHNGVYVDTSAKTKENIHKVKKKGGLERCLTDTLDWITFEPQSATTSHKRSLSPRDFGWSLTGVSTVMAYNRCSQYFDCDFFFKALAVDIYPRGKTLFFLCKAKEIESVAHI